MPAVSKNMADTPSKPRKRRYGFVTPFKDNVCKSGLTNTTPTTTHNQVTHGRPIANNLTPPEKVNDLSAHSNSHLKLEDSDLPMVTTTPTLKRSRRINHSYKSPLLTTNATLSAGNYLGETELSKLKDELEKLRSVAYHKKHNDLATLASLTERWRNAAHKALHEVQDNLNFENKPSLRMILQGLNIHDPASLIGCDCEEDVLNNDVSVSSGD